MLNKMSFNFYHNFVALLLDKIREMLFSITWADMNTCLKPLCQSCPILTTCSGRESAFTTRASRTSQVVSVILLMKIT